MDDQTRWAKLLVQTCLVTRPKYPPPYRETGVAIPLSHCVSCGIADYRCYTPTSFLKMAYRSPKTGLGRRVSQKKLASEANRAIVWKDTKEYLNQRGTKIRVFRDRFRAPFLPPLSPRFSPLFPPQALFTFPPLLPSSPPPLSPLF